MHELSLAESVLQIIEDAAHEQKFTRVKTVWLEIGQLACVEQESLPFYFEVVIRDSIAQRAKLVIINIVGQGWCDKCEREVPLASHHDSCPNCGQYGLKVTQGDAMQIKELEVE